MRKPGRGQILENRLVGPREVLGGGDRRVPAKGRGRTAPCRGRSGASWIWATPLTPARARGSSERAVSKDGYSSFLFNPLWGVPVVAAGILFVVDQSSAGFWPPCASDASSAWVNSIKPSTNCLGNSTAGLSANLRAIASSSSGVWISPLSDPYPGSVISWLAGRKPA